jgi:hypothetical protein
MYLKIDFHMISSIETKKYEPDLMTDPMRCASAGEQKCTFSFREQGDWYNKRLFAEKKNAESPVPSLIILSITFSAALLSGLA